MPETVVDPPDPFCSILLSETEIPKSQSLGPNALLASRARGKKGISPREAPATHAAGRAASPIPSGACPILWPGR